VVPLVAHGGGAAHPAGGSAVEDLIGASIVALVAFALLAALGAAHRTGRWQGLRRMARASERLTGMPGWAALPSAISAVALFVAVIGYYWDVSLHIDAGRDPGPFANAAHWWIILGLAGLGAAGALGVLLGVPASQPGAIRIRRGWHTSIGSLLLTVTGWVALAGFPLDDVWHRLFGQDVTLWSPTHVQMVGGASLATLALWILFVEGRHASRGEAGLPWVVRLRAFTLAGAFLVGLSTLQGEFDFGVPQFRLLYQPVLIALAAGLALVPARIRLGRGGALGAVASFLVLRGLLTLLVSGVLGHMLLHVPLYIGAAVAVEAAALLVPPRRQITFGAVAGVGIAVLGLGVEWAWTQVAMPMAWTSRLFPEFALALAAAAAAGVLGGLIGRALVAADAPRQRDSAALPWAAALATVVAVGALVYPAFTTGAPGSSVRMGLEEASPGPERTVHATFTLDPAGLAERAEWVHVIAWQGAGGEHPTSVVQHLERVREGVYRTVAPVPVHGEWKTMLRIHRDGILVGAPVFMPEDVVIAAPEVPAVDGVTRELVPDRQLLLREARPAAAWLVWTAHVAMFALLAAWVAAFAWGLRRLRLALQAHTPAPSVAGVDELSPR
jgi:hypothetical protein